MLEFADAIRELTNGVSRLGRERVSLNDARSRVLAEDLRAEAPLPAFDYSAMDGYAVHSSDFAAAGPWTFPVEGESRTGSTPSVFRQKSACRIFTGAEIPAGANSVVPQEVVERDGSMARFQRRPEAFANVRRRGEDIAAGDLALPDGTALGPAQLALAAGLDRAELWVARRPRVCILSTGDELRAPGSPARPGTVPESNAIAIAGYCLRAGALVNVLPPAADRAREMTEVVRAALASSDLLLTIGGASVGDYDVVRPALEAAGVSITFHKVNIRPGKPILHGKTAGCLVLGLPGNPVSAQVTCLLFCVPLLAALLGTREPALPWRSATLTRAIQHEPGRHAFMRARLDENRATPLGNQASGALLSMAHANALIHVPAEVVELSAESAVRVLPLDAM